MRELKLTTFPEKEAETSVMTYLFNLNVMGRRNDLKIIQMSTCRTETLQIVSHNIFIYIYL